MNIEKNAISETCIEDTN